jgi:zinc transport system ATP-binding protein
MRLLIGAEAPTAGRMERRPGLRIGYVPQRLAVDYTMPMTVRRFLALSGGTAAEGAHALERVGIPELGDRQMRALSGGQFQRALLAQALMRRPHLLVLDEAAQGLDQPGTARFYELVGELRRELGCAVVMVGHDLHVVMAASDRVVCLNGHVCCEGSPTVVSAAPEYRALFGLGTRGAFALYRHEHDHVHGEPGEPARAWGTGSGGHRRGNGSAWRRGRGAAPVTLLDSFIWRAAFAGVGVAVAAGPLGCFVVWRRMAYFGDATSHAALLGVALALATELPMAAGVAFAALAMALTVSAASGRTYAMDTMLGVASHAALATGLVAVSFVAGVRIDLTAYLFGDILAVDAAISS